MSCHASRWVRSFINQDIFLGLIAPLCDTLCEWSATHPTDIEHFSTEHVAMRLDNQQPGLLGPNFPAAQNVGWVHRDSELLRHERTRSHGLGKFVGGTVCGLLLTVIFAANLPGQTSPQPPVSATAIPHDLARLYLEHAHELAAEDAGKLWGVSLQGPMIFVDSASRYAVANQADAGRILENKDGLWCGILPPEVTLANTSTEWSGVRWTMVLWSSVPQNRFARGRLLMHESLHRVQPALGISAASPINSHLDSLAGRLWLRLEMRALAEALIHQGSERLEHLQAAWQFRGIRRAECGGSCGVEEDQLEANEGVCEYTGFRLSGLPTAVLPDRVAVELERSESSASLTRSFAYATGPALALLLDEYEPAWRESFAAEPNLAARLAAAAGLVDARITREEVIELAKSYGWQEIYWVESERDARRQRRLAELASMFETGRVLQIETGSKFQFSFDPNAAESFDSQRVVHRSVTASDEWGTVEAKQGALIDFRAPMKLVLPIPPGATLETVPWKLELHPDYQLDTSHDRIWKIKKR
jgi:hypothetical protein